MSKKDVQVNFRMPEELKATLEAVAKENNRSLTAEVVSRLENSFINEPVIVPTHLTNKIEELIQQVQHQVDLMKIERNARGIVDLTKDPSDPDY